MRLRLYIAVIVLVASSWGCKKDKIEFDTSPLLSLESTTPTVLQEFSSPVEFTITYTDGDGDLGFSDPDRYAIVLQDARLAQPDLYYVQPLAPIGSNVPIQGKLTIKLNSIFLLGSGNVAETTTFNIRIVDRAGNWSNIVTSPTITINP
jgi:hypothetical protein